MSSRWNLCLFIQIITTEKHIGDGAELRAAFHLDSKLPANAAGSDEVAGGDVFGLTVSRVLSLNFNTVVILMKFDEFHAESYGDVVECL